MLATKSETADRSLAAAIDLLDKATAARIAGRDWLADRHEDDAAALEKVELEAREEATWIASLLAAGESDR